MSINPMQIMQAMNNPQQFVKQMMNSSQVMQNPMARNAMEMMQKGDMQGIENMARNLCKEKGIDPNEAMNQIKSQFGIK
uniref:Uncharacterized protein n=1 Tax=Dulem virus 39 TaxID=3145757 RepID=A0AAU8B7I3_9CAUD